MKDIEKLKGLLDSFGIKYDQCDYDNCQEIVIDNTYDRIVFEFTFGKSSDLYTVQKDC